MDWMEVLEQVFELIVYPALGIIGAYLTYLINLKITQLKQKMNNDTAKKYFDMLNVTIQSAVLATTQTYVDSLKQQGKFDEEAQKVAFKQTYDAVMKILSDDAVEYLNEIVGDVQEYIANRIEAEIKLNK
jgi:hypothetical protein